MGAPPELVAEQLGVCDATWRDSRQAGWWIIKGFAVSPVGKKLGVPFVVVWLGGLMLLIFHSAFGPWEWALYVLGTLASPVALWLVTAAVYERARLHRAKQMFVSPEKDSVLTIERKVIDNIPVYKPRHHTVKTIGKGLGWAMRAQIQETRAVEPEKHEERKNRWHSWANNG